MFSQFFINRPRFAIVISIIIVVTGLVALTELPIAQFPQITPPQVQIFAYYPGASADIVEKTVLAPIEQEINGVKGMVYMSSRCSNDGYAFINITFESGTDGDINTVNVQNKLSLALPKLPEEVRKIGVTVKEKTTDMLLVINLYSPDERYDRAFLSNYAAVNLIDPLARIQGVGEANIIGNADYSMRIWLDPDKLNSFKLTTTDIANAINEQNIQVPAGKIGSAPTGEGQKLQYTLRTKGRLSSVKEFENIIVRANSDGSYIRLKDVADVELGSESYSSFGELNGQPSVNIAIYQLPDANAVDISDEIKEKIDTLSDRFPEGIKCSILYDTTDYVKTSIKEVVLTLFISVVLVILVVYIFLQDWRSTLVPVITIPVSLIGTLGALLALGYSINTVTLFGLILAIGTVVDDAIVVIENVIRIMEEEGLDPVEATKKSMFQISSPVIATTLVLLAVFVPIAFIPGISGVLYRQFAVTICVAVCISTLNALTLSPALCATVLSSERRPPLKIFKYYNKAFNWLTEKYNKTVSFLIRKLLLVVVLFIMLLCGTYFLYKYLPTGFVPEEDKKAFLVNIQLPDGASLNRTHRIVRKVNQILSETEGVDNVVASTGFGLISGMLAANEGMVIAVLDDWDKRKSKDLHVNAILNKLRPQFQAIPAADIIAFCPPAIPGLGATSGFEYVLLNTIGATPQQLADVMRAVISEASRQPEIANAYCTFSANVPQLYIDLDRDKAKKLGINILDIFHTLQGQLGSLYVNDFNLASKVYKVIIQAQENFRSTDKDIDKLFVRDKDNNMIPLSTLVDTTNMSGPEIIYRYNMYPSATIKGFPAEGYSSGQAMKAMERVSKKVLPKGFSYDWTGISYQEKLAGEKVIFIFLLSILFIYLFLVAQYESWMIAFAVMLSVPIAFFGALGALFLTGIENNIYTQIGFVLLFGLASKTAILIVEFAKEQRESGKSILEAAEIAGSLRFRAVLMTAISFVLGVLPLVFAAGAGAASRRALGTAVFGGMLIACIFGTIFVPSFYVIIQKITERFYSKKKK
jgi:hydrophobic/amphiphilic exporter-1 (mainly G- bacteria), HAE1 family